MRFARVPAKRALDWKMARRLRRANAVLERTFYDADGRTFVGILGDPAYDALFTLGIEIEAAARRLEDS